MSGQGPPPGQGPPQDLGPRLNLTPVLRGVDIFFIIASTLIIIGRLYSRFIYKKNASYDDYVAILAWAVTITETGVEIAASPGTGTTIASIPFEWLPHFFQLVFAAQVLTIFASSLIRLSIVAFLPRLSQFQKFRRTLIGVAVFIAVYTTAFFITALVLYIPSKGPVTEAPKSLARTPKAERIFFDAHQGIGLGIDLFLLGTPLWLIYKNSFSLKKNANVLLIFSVGLFTIAADLVRCVMISRINNTSSRSRGFFNVALWTTLELHVGLWVACFPSLVPVIRMIHERLSGAFRTPDSTQAGSKRSWTLQGKQSSGKKDISSPMRTEDTALTELGDLSSRSLEPWNVGTEGPSESTHGNRVEIVSNV